MGNSASSQTRWKKSKKVLRGVSRCLTCCPSMTYGRRKSGTREVVEEVGEVWDGGEPGEEENRVFAVERSDRISSSYGRVM